MWGNGLCHCRREAHGFYYQRHLGDRQIWCCSMRCLDIAFERQGHMIDPTNHEIAAIQAASQPAGEYIEELGETDMATWSNDQWMGFLETVITAYTDEMGRLSKNGDPPFG
jgi:hypothetical protein